jgi:hypothetical protein
LTSNFEYHLSFSVATQPFKSQPAEIIFPLGAVSQLGESFLQRLFFCFGVRVLTSYSRDGSQLTVLESVIENVADVATNQLEIILIGLAASKLADGSMISD